MSEAISEAEDALDFQDYSDLRLSLDESLKIYDAKALGQNRLGTRAFKKDTFTDYLPKQPEPKLVPLSNIPTLPPPELKPLTGNKRKREDDAEAEQPAAKKAKSDSNPTLSLDEGFKIYDAETLGQLRTGTRAVQKNNPVDDTPSRTKDVPLIHTPVQHSSELAALSGQKRKREDDTEETKRVSKRARISEEETEEEKATFKPFGHFGMPFNTSDGSEVGLTPHPQLVMARTLEDCTHTMVVGRELTTQTILKVDHAELDEISSDFDKKLQESIEKAKEQKNLSYLQTALQFLTITVGITGGIIVQLAGASSGNPAGIAYGMEMTIGGLLSLGSFCLDQIGYKNSTFTSLLALGGALLSAHGGIMASPLLAQELPSHLASFYSGTITLLNGYGIFKNMEVQADLSRFSGELTTLSKKQKVATDDLKKHYGALNISDFKHLFKAATDFVDQTNQATKKVIQGTLKG